MTTFTVDRLKKKYSAKKKSCMKRKIPLLLTEEEFLFLYQNCDMVCDYTGEVMNDKQGDPNRLTLERIEAEKPYELGNICFVTDKANHVKNAMFDHKEGTERITVQGKYRETLFQLIDVMKDSGFIEKLKNKYSRENVNNLMKEKKPMTQVSKLKDVAYETNEVNVVTKTHNKELDLAKCYFEFGNFIEQVVESGFSITLGEFKRMTSRKKCMLTGRDLPESLFQLGFFILDKKSAITKDNVFVTTKPIQEGLDRLQADIKLTKDEIINMAKVLGKK